jgi:hypothetical protein
MNSKLLIFVVMVLALAAGYSLGSYFTVQSSNQIVDEQLRTVVKDRTKDDLQLLKYLRDGNQSEAAALLERRLDDGLIQCATFWDAPAQGQRDILDLMIFSDARDYRLHHPWTNDKPDIAAKVRKMDRNRQSNKSPEPTAVGACSSAVAVHVAGRRWLSFFR